ncbi:probable pectinesterase/pectinesterase inhibitor 20 [Lotus japonicus]|uniref:probable pectinesterase/pectinesterase inhibitor 20 n=1 Tax=Lotus japonicus TaxID=34305 RepID=UPI002585439B|nr:probable pectinesterase/pectinesterase inhibitor 20 [Lotus japonicus]
MQTLLYIEMYFLNLSIIHHIRSCMTMGSKVSSIATFSFSFLLIFLFIGFFAFANGKDEGTHNVYGTSVLISDSVVVSQDGSGNFNTINQAVAAAPNNNNAIKGYFLINIKEGVYKEYVFIPKNKPYIMMVGQGFNRTVITGNRNHDQGLKTHDTPTFGFVAINLTFQNTARPSKEQAVALRNEADMSTFYRCIFDGHQDTLYVDKNRQFYIECDIYGTVDFIFGGAQVVLQNCNIYPRLPQHRQFNTITASERMSPPDKAAITIHNCTVKPTRDLASSNGSVKTYLGRPWKKYSRVVVMQTFLDSLIDPAGWFIGKGDGTSYFAEYDNRGPGANTSGRATWPGYHLINAADAAKFTVANFLQGNDWLPQTGVPYFPGLMP